MSAGIVIISESKKAKPSAKGDFVFIGDSPK
jgi:hypothetical protein